MKIRNYREEDCQATYQLFYETVQRINRHDYPPAQLAVWAKPEMGPDWHRSLAQHYSLVAEINQTIVGFGDIDQGYLDRLYVHHAYQGQGIAKALVENLEQHASQEHRQVTVAASITAKPFFLKRGYQVVREQQVERQGQCLTNYLMAKQLIKNEDEYGEKEANQQMTEGRST
ncbi:GNAT family N-acetyltransferase [uncultured Vagococcus sp.]|uniref:GNAT family N-acetyltransferase n=1 Tax=uncultured Vagococcus sp. TaxID=189676 RepID=UPI0028D5A9E7|nr:GNAT family N-acetyltransferase [uncultured Vagococcus sp.]